MICLDVFQDIFTIIYNFYHIYNDDLRLSILNKNTKLNMFIYLYAYVK